MTTECAAVHFAFAPCYRFASSSRFCWNAAQKLPLLSRPFSFWFSFAHRQPDDEARGKRAGLTTMADDGQASRALWSDLPPELLAQSVSRLSQWQDVVAVAGTCRTWRRAAKQALAAGTSEPTDVEKDAGSEVAFEWSDWETLDESIASTSRRR